LRIGDDTPFRKAFFSRCALGVGEASEQDGFDVLVVFLVGLVLVCFEIGGERPFGNSLGVFFGGVVLADGARSF